MCSRFKYTIPEQFTKGMTRNMFSDDHVVEAVQGHKLPILTENGYTYMAVWRGFARIETLKQVWLQKGWRKVKIVNGTGFIERNTVKKNGKFQGFSLKPGTEIGAIAKIMKSSSGKKHVEVKMVTQPAQGPVKEIHHRMPFILENK